jgi:hypothetical protein
MHAETARIHADKHLRHSFRVPLLLLPAGRSDRYFEKMKRLGGSSLLEADVTRIVIGGFFDAYNQLGPWISRIGL